MELFMLHVRIGSETFYDTAKRKEIERRMERLRREETNSVDLSQVTSDAPFESLNNSMRYIILSFYRNSTKLLKGLSTID